MPDIVLYSVPTDGTNDVRLRNPNSIPGAVTGTLAAVEAQDTASFAGILEYSGSLAATEAQDIATFAGALVYSGALAASEAQDIAAFNGTVTALVTGNLSATEAPDVASFDGTVTDGTQSLHGRRPRGRRVIYPDELDPLPEPVIEAPEPLPSLETAQAALIAAKDALEQAIRTKAEKQQAKERAEAIATLRTALGAAQAQYDAAKEREDAIIKRLRDEDEFWLLAA